VGNVIMSSVEPSRGGEAGGLQGTSLNLGASLGVALVGSIVIGLLATNFTTTVMASPSLSDETKQQVSAAAEANANFVPTSQVEAAATDAGLSAAETEELVTVYSDAQIEALRAGFAFLGLFALVALVWVRRLPDKPADVVQDEAAVP